MISPQSLTRADVMQLQRALGNQAFGRMMQDNGLMNSEPIQRMESELRNDSEFVSANVPVQRAPIPEAGDENGLPIQGTFEATQREELRENKDEEPLQTTRENKTGMPDQLKAGIKSLSGIDMSDVRVHYNSDKPAEVGAVAFTRGMDIHVASGQEKHLPHEAWHVVQQAQGRVQPTMQLKDVAVNDDAGLEREADLMGERAIQMKFAGKIGKISKQISQNHLSRVMQLQKRLRIGILGPISDNNLEKVKKIKEIKSLEKETYVCILSNRIGNIDINNSNDQSRKNATKDLTPQKIIDANIMKNNIFKHPLWYCQKPQGNGKATKGIFLSGVFIVPGNENDKDRKPDYSFLRFAAFKSYQKWYEYEGKNKGWPDISSVTTLLETIDSDYSGITGETGDSKIKNQKDNQTQNDRVLAEAGIYRWDWREVKDHEEIDNKSDKCIRKRKLKQFAQLYAKAEAEKRKAAFSKDKLSLYFPEPATRISSYAVTLLNNSGLENMKLPTGKPLGYSRESIGLIAGLVYLDVQNQLKKQRKKTQQMLKKEPSLSYCLILILKLLLV